MEDASESPNCGVSGRGRLGWSGPIVAIALAMSTDHFLLLAAAPARMLHLNRPTGRRAGLLAATHCDGACFGAASADTRWVGSYALAIFCANNLSQTRIARIGSVTMACINPSRGIAVTFNAATRPRSVQNVCGRRGLGEYDNGYQRCREAD